MLAVNANFQASKDHSFGPCMSKSLTLKSMSSTVYKCRCDVQGGKAIALLKSPVSKSFDFLRLKARAIKLFY
jgi:hypothetical protein